MDELDIFMTCFMPDVSQNNQSGPFIIKIYHSTSSPLLFYCLEMNLKPDLRNHIAKHFIVTHLELTQLKGSSWHAVLTVGLSDTGEVPAR